MKIDGITDRVLQVTHQQSNNHFNQFHSDVLIWFVHCKFAISTSHSDRTSAWCKPTAGVYKS